MVESTIQGDVPSLRTARLDALATLAVGRSRAEAGDFRMHTTGSG